MRENAIRQKNINHLNREDSDGYKPQAVPNALKVINSTKNLVNEGAKTMDDHMEVTNINCTEMIMIGAQMSLPPSSPDAFKRLSEQLDAMRHQIRHKIEDNTYEITSDDGTKFTIAVAVSNVENVPDDLVVLTIPAGEYVTFKFEEKHVGAFWDHFCNREAREKYNLDTVKPRLEVFNSKLQPKGFTQIYYPTKRE